MFMTDIVGVFAAAIRPINWRTPSAPYCGSASRGSPDQSRTGRNLREQALTPPDKFRESNSMASRALTGRRTRVPSALTSFAPGAVQTMVALWPARAILLANNEP